MSAAVMSLSLDAIIRIGPVLDVAGGMLLGHTHLGGICRVRYPLGTGASRGLLEHLVDLFKGKTLGLGDEEVGVDEAAAAETAPDVEDLGTKVTLVLVDHVRGDDGDDAVPFEMKG